MSVPILLANTVTRLAAEHAGSVLVTGSHGGLVAARYVAQAGVRAAVFNDAGRGRDNAGIAGIAALDRIGVAAATVAHTSARIADARDAWDHGIVSCANAAAAALGVGAGMRCAEAARRLCAARWNAGDVPASDQARLLLVAGTAVAAPVWALDSIGFVAAEHNGVVLIIGSHGGLHGGDPASALQVRAQGAIFHDAGRGKDDAGVSRLPVLAARGMPAAAVDYRSARIGDARSMWDTGVLSAVNACAAAVGVVAGMGVRDAVAPLRVVRLAS